MDYIIPPIKLTGQFKLKTPLTGLINEKVTYTTTAVKTISDYIADDYDVKTLIYTNQGLTEDEYNKDLIDDMVIVTLRSEGNALTFVPATYIVTMPVIVGTTYNNKAIIINLGYVPKLLNLDFLLPEVTDLIDSLTGLKSVATLETISGDYIETYENSDVLEANRANNITNSSTCKTELNSALSTIDIYKLKVKSLISKIEQLTS